MAFYAETDFVQAERSPGFVVRSTDGNTMTVATGTIVDKAGLPGHSHPHQQIANVLDGEFELTIDARTQRMGPGGIAISSSNVPHSGRAITTHRVVGMFHPVRDDFR